MVQSKPKLVGEFCMLLHVDMHDGESVMVEVVYDMVVIGYVPV